MKPPTAYSDGDLVDQEEGGYTEEQNDPKAVVIVPAVLMTVYEKVPLRMADGTVTEPLWCLQNRSGNYTRMDNLDLSQGLQAKSRSCWSVCHGAHGCLD